VTAMWPAEETPRRNYEKALRQRNRLLKEHEGAAPPDLEAWDAEVARHGAAVTAGRAAAVDQVSPRAGDEFETVAGERLRVEYRPSVEPGPDLEAEFLKRLAARRDDELLRRTTLVGPHRDDLELAVGEMTARRFASHGESWAGALCLRLGLAEALGADMDEPPVLFLDDPFSGLDPVRRRRLGEALSGRGQVLVAVPDEAQVPEGAEVWEVAGGRIRPQ
jgi:DNA replication and repair protein RecF